MQGSDTGFGWEGKLRRGEEREEIKRAKGQKGMTRGEAYRMNLNYRRIATAKALYYDTDLFSFPFLS